MAIFVFVSTFTYTWFNFEMRKDSYESWTVISPFIISRSMQKWCSFVGMLHTGGLSIYSRYSLSVFKRIRHCFNRTNRLDFYSNLTILNSTKLLLIILQEVDTSGLSRMHHMHHPKDSLHAIVSLGSVSIAIDRKIVFSSPSFVTSLSLFKRDSVQLHIHPR